MGQHADFDKITIANGAGIARDERDRDDRENGYDRHGYLFP
jgi:hypothetical protein